MINKQMNMDEILDLDDRIADILASYGLDCQHCSGAQSETLEEAAKGHGVILEDLIEALNEALRD
jgi:hybrid cluster-associated redox disulfide protein